MQTKTNSSAATEEKAQQQQQDPMDAVRGALEARQESNAGGLPVTVLSGFLGAGKTTVVKHILENRKGLRVALVVNDMAEVNVDANLLVKSEEKMVELSNGCICCTLREDLFVELTKLARRGDLDHVVIESSGISEPLPVAETFTFQDGKGNSLSDVAKLDTLVTVVDGESFLHELHTAEELRGRGWEISKEDDRTIAQLFCDQLEFANVIVMNKMDLLNDEEKARLRAILRRFNPTANLIDAVWGRVDPAKLLGTGLFEMAWAQEHPEWLQEARENEHTPETIEYGISSITFRSRRPFHVKRFEELTAIMCETRTELFNKGKERDEQSAAASSADEAGGDSDAPDEEKKKEDSSKPLPQSSVSEAGRRAALSVIRSKGLVWLGNEQSHWQAGTASLAGRRFKISFAAPWFATTSTPPDFSPPDDADDATIKLWQKPWGDRRTELVVIGQNMDNKEMRAALEACVLTDKEMDRYKELFQKAHPLGLDTIKGDSVDSITNYKINNLDSKSRKVQFLTAAPKAWEAVSAHSCIAVFQSNQDRTEADSGLVACFQIERYLKYAHIVPELASGFVQEFEFPVAAADAQAGFLTEDSQGGGLLAKTIAKLNAGDKVFLAWLQIRAELETDNEKDRYMIIEFCNKLSVLDAAAEKMMLQQYPQPEVMIPQD